MKNNNMKRYKILKENHRVRKCQLCSTLFQGAIASILCLTGDSMAIEVSAGVSEVVRILMLNVEDTSHSYLLIVLNNGFILFACIYLACKTF